MRISSVSLFSSTIGGSVVGSAGVVADVEADGVADAEGDEVAALSDGEGLKGTIDASSGVFSTGLSSSGTLIVLLSLFVHGKISVNIHRAAIARIMTAMPAIIGIRSLFFFLASSPVA